MHLSAVLTLGLALSVAASPNPAKTRTKTRTPKPTATPKPELCTNGVRGGFSVECNTFEVAGGKYNDGEQNDLTDKGRTIQECINACAGTANCCAGNLNLVGAANGDLGVCILSIKPASDATCQARSVYFTDKANSQNHVAFFKQ